MLTAALEAEVDVTLALGEGTWPEVGQWLSQMCGAGIVRWRQHVDVVRARGVWDRVVELRSDDLGHPTVDGIGGSGQGLDHLGRQGGALMDAEDLGDLRFDLPGGVEGQ